MSLGRQGIAVTPASRYDSVVGRRWPVGVAPAPGELLSSWLHRLAHSNGVPPRYFGGFLGAAGENWSAQLDRRLPDRILRVLTEHTRVPLEDITGLIVEPDPLARLRLPLRPRLGGTCASRSQAYWLQFCPACLVEDETPYFRRGWTLASRVSCFRHGCRLRDRCPSCGGELAPFRQDRLVPHQYCIHCGARLGKRTAPANPGVRRLELLVDDLLRLHATGHRLPGKKSAPDLLSADWFIVGSEKKSITRLSHRDRYLLFQSMADGSLPFEERRSNTAIAFWAQVASAAPTYRGLAESFTDAVMARSAPGPRTPSARPDLAELVLAATRLHQKGPTL